MDDNIAGGGPEFRNELPEIDPGIPCTLQLGDKFNGKTCVPRETIVQVAQKKQVEVGNNEDPDVILKKIAKADGIDSNIKNIHHLETKVLKNYIDDIGVYFKPKGPSNSTQLLDNFNIDDTLSRFEILGKELFGKKFYHVKFQMIDFMEIGSDLANINLLKLINDGYDCMGVIINTDVHTGGGKHWFALYCDLSSNPITIEHFNSSGNPARESVIEWTTKQAEKLRASGKQVFEILAGSKTVQKSNTECGMWSIIYILWRLTGHTREEFYSTGPSDDDMIKLRKLIFT